MKKSPGDSSEVEASRPGGKAARCALELGREGLEKRLHALGAPPYRARQILRWIFQKGATSFAEMTDLPASLRARLEEELPVLSSRVVRESRSASGETTKVLLELLDGEPIETVLIREGDRRTACVSTQVGCPVACVFCASGLEGVTRNLEAHEIVEQALAIQRLLPPEQRLTNLVVMGAGEPMLNLKNLDAALDILHDPEGLGLGARRITVSTVGFPDRIRRFAERTTPVELAISLHAPNDELRARIIPGARPLAPLLEAARDYTRKTGREVTFEYVLLDGINDSPQTARELAGLLRGQRCLVNLIPHNPVQGVALTSPPEARSHEFQGILESAGVRTTLRKTKGQSIDAACGQLRRVHRAEIVPKDA